MAVSGGHERKGERVGMNLTVERTETGMMGRESNLLV